MKIQSVNKIRLKKSVENILRGPGALLHQILEIAVVIDCDMEQQEAAETVSELAFALKSFGETFRNVRVNVIWWKSETERVQEIKPLAALQMSSFWEGRSIGRKSNPDLVAEDAGSIEAKKTMQREDGQNEKEKSLDSLAEYMRKFQARSKIVFLVTSEERLCVKDKEQIRIHMTPMLHRKWLILHKDRIERLSVEGEVLALP